MMREGDWLIGSEEIKRYKIHGFSRYEVLLPFCVFDTQKKKPVKIANKRTMYVYDDNGKRRLMSYITLACLAFHGIRPIGFAAFHRGGEIVPESVGWYVDRLARRLRTQALSEKERLEVRVLYFKQGKTQKWIAEKFGVAASTISRTLNR